MILLLVFMSVLICGETLNRPKLSGHFLVQCALLILLGLYKEPRPLSGLRVTVKEHVHPNRWLRTGPTHTQIEAVQVKCGKFQTCGEINRLVCLCRSRVLPAAKKAFVSVWAVPEAAWIFETTVDEYCRFAELHPGNNELFKGTHNEELHLQV